MLDLPDPSQLRESIAAITQNAVEVISSSELAAKLAEGRPLRIKLGMDPTAPDLHLGHTITLKKLRAFQQRGHIVIFLVGDFTAMIGDPTGRSDTRKPLSPEQIRLNADTYKQQVAKVLDLSKMEIRFNSEWMNQVDTRKLIEIAAKLSVARMLERDDFEKRLAEQEPLFLHELLYPLVQGYDSVALGADVELGGTDQKFNMLVGRDLQRAFGMVPQVVITMPLLEGTDGVNKMSKSLGNYIGISEDPDSMFGKVMSISDVLMWRYYELLSFRPLGDIANLRRAADAGRNPRDIKLELAAEITARFHDAAAAERAQRNFMSRVSEKAVPQDLPVKVIAVEAAGLRIANLLKEAGLAASTSEANRKIDEGAVKIDGVRVSDRALVLKAGVEHVFQLGAKRFARVRLEAKG